MQMPKLLRDLTISQKLVLSCTAILLLSILLFGWMVYAQWQSSTQQQADALGETLISQTAKEAMISLAAEDTLGLNILLRELINNPYVSHAALYSPDNSTLVEVGKRPAANSNLYSHQLTFQRVLAGTLQISIDVKRLQQPMYKSLQSMALLALLILAVAMYLVHRLAVSIRKPMQTLKYWTQNPVTAAPHTERNDEIGHLAQALDALLAPPVLHDLLAAEQADSEPDKQTASNQHLDVMQLPSGVLDTCNHATADAEKAKTATIVLAVQLSLSKKQEHLSSQRLTQLFDTYHHALIKTAELYSAQLIQLDDGRTLLFFDDSNEHFVRYSLCCGELLREFGHSLQVDIADSGITVGLQLGISYGEVISDLTPASLLNQPSVKSALELSRFSRNLLLVSNELAVDSRAQACARIRSIARPEGANCVERLLAPYPAQLDKQLQILMQ